MLPLQVVVLLLLMMLLLLSSLLLLVVVVASRYRYFHLRGRVLFRLLFDRKLNAPFTNNGVVESRSKTTVRLVQARDCGCRRRSSSSPYRRCSGGVGLPSRVLLARL